MGNSTKHEEPRRPPSRVLPQLLANHTESRRSGVPRRRVPPPLALPRVADPKTAPWAPNSEALQERSSRSDPPPPDAHPATPASRAETHHPIATAPDDSSGAHAPYSRTLPDRVGSVRRDAADPESPPRTGLAIGDTPGCADRPGRNESATGTAEIPSRQTGVRPRRHEESGAPVGS